MKILTNNRASSASTTPGQHWTGAAILVFILAVVLAATRAPLLGDTGLYANEIAPFLTKSAWGAKPLWEFGHLLWRPMGWALTTLLAPAFHLWTDWTPVMQVIFVLICVSTLSAAIAVVFCYWLLLDVTNSPRCAGGLTLAFLFLHGFLLYSHSGTAYVPGLAALTVSLYLVRRGKTARGAAFYAVAALFWLPYILAGLGLLLTASFPLGWDEPLALLRRRFEPRRAILFLAVAGAITLGGYGLAGAARSVSSIQEAKAWASDASHGVQQSIRVARLATALPRSFLVLGRDGVLYRRFLFRDPMAPVGAMDLVKASLWKIAAFNIFCLCLAVELFRRRGWVTVVLTAAVVPVLFFAVFIFEPSAPERYLPAMPFMWISLAVVLRDFTWHRGPGRVAQWAMLAFLAVMGANNVYSFARPLVSAEDDATLARVRPFRWKMPPESVVMIATNQDLLGEVMSRSPFGAINRPSPLPIFDILLVAAKELPLWRERFAQRALQTWASGGEVWVTKRVWEPLARPEWYWVEGEDQRVSWKDVGPYFSQLATEADEGGPDGFRRVARNEVNRLQLEKNVLAIKK
jgi:hypothetical protein